MFCPKCGTENSSNNNYCVKCGEKLNNGDLFDRDNSHDDYYYNRLTSESFKSMDYTKKYNIDLNGNKTLIVILIMVVIMVSFIVFVLYDIIQSRFFDDFVPTSPVVSQIIIIFSLFTVLIIVILVAYIRMAVNAKKAREALQSGKVNKAIVIDKFTRVYRNSLNVSHYVEIAYLVDNLKYRVRQKVHESTYDNIKVGSVVEIYELNTIGVIKESI